MDVFWSNDPQLIEEPDVDLQASEQGYGKGDLNLGFFIAQPTRAARGLFRRLARWPHSSQYIHCWDQAYFDFAVRGSFAILDDVCKRPLSPHAREIIRSALHPPPLNVKHGADLPHITSATPLMATRQHAEAPRLRWRPISYELLPHPFKWHAKLPQQLPRAVIALGGVLAVHLWSTVTPVPPAERIACARMLGFWSLPNGEQAATALADGTSAWGGSSSSRRSHVTILRSAATRARRLSSVPFEQITEITSSLDAAPEAVPASADAYPQTAQTQAIGSQSRPPPVEAGAHRTAPRLRVGPLMRESEKVLPHEQVYYREAIVALIGRLRAARARELAALGYRPHAHSPRFLPFVPMQRYGRDTWPNGTSFAAKDAPRPSARLNYALPGGKCAAGMFTAFE